MDWVVTVAMAGWLGATNLLIAGRMKQLSKTWRVLGVNRKLDWYDGFCNQRGRGDQHGIFSLAGDGSSGTSLGDGQGVGVFIGGIVSVDMSVEYLVSCRNIGSYKGELKK